MDPNHRDRIAMVRLCSGRFQRGMKLKVQNTGRQLSVNAPIMFFASDRELAEEAFAGDVIADWNTATVPPPPELKDVTVEPAAVAEFMGTLLPGTRKEFMETMATVPLLIIDDFGGWKQVNDDFFDPPELYAARKSPEASEKSYLHRGIATRAFDRRFALADHVRVTGATHENGMLHIDLVRETPEALKPRRIEIGRLTDAARSVTATQADTIDA